MTGTRDPDFERLITLSDGVFAIAMTLTALDLHAPSGHADTLTALLVGLAPPFQAFFWSFFATAIFWTTHRRLLRHYRSAGTGLIVLNFFFLGGITLVPVATRNLSELAMATPAIELAVGLFALIGLLSAAIWLHASAVARVVQPQPGPFVIAAVAAIQFLLPVLTSGCGMLSGLPGRHWAWLAIPAIVGAASLVRRLAARLDRRLAPAAAEAL